MRGELLGQPIEVRPQGGGACEVRVGDGEGPRMVMPCERARQLLPGR